MEPFRIHILGCGSALPTLKHYPTSQIIELRGKAFMIDCGEGAQIQFSAPAFILGKSMPSSFLIFMVTIALACSDYFLPLGC